MASGAGELHVGILMEFNKSNKENYTANKLLLVPDNGIIWLVLALLVGIWLRGYFIAQPMRYDESYTFLNFVNRDLKQLFFYPLPNNHVLHSILTKVSTLVWGNHPVSIRFIAFLAGNALIPLVYILCRTLKQSGVFASITLAVFPYFVLYSTNARGYTLVVLFTLSLALIGARIAKQLSISKTASFSLVAALGMLTMPTMLFPIAGIYLWVLLLLFISGHTQKRVFYEFALPSILITSTLTALFYTPVILVSNGIQSIIANRFVKAQPWQKFISQMYPHFNQTFIDFTRDIPDVLLLVATILFAIGLYSAVKQRNWPTLLILPSILLTSVILFVIKQKIPFARTWIYIIPFFILVADSGFTYVTSTVSIRMQSLLKITAFSISFFIAVSLMSKNTIATYHDTGTFAEAEIVAKYLKPIMSRNDLIHVRVPADFPVYFYLWYYNVSKVKVDAEYESRQEYFVVKKSRYSIADMTSKQFITLINIGDLALYQSIGIDDN